MGSDFMYRILVVEDEDDIQKILKNYLIDQGYTVTQAYDGVDCKISQWLV